MIDELQTEGHPPSAGAFSQWLDAAQHAVRGEATAVVPCEACTACCTSSQFVHIAPDEVATLARIPADLRFPAPRLPAGHVVLGYDERGHCPMLVDGACSIYDDRPRTCRAYDCRIFPASGVELDDTEKAAIAERARQWRFEFPDAVDRAERAAVVAAARFVRDHADLLPAAVAPFTATQHAVVAIQVHRAFLDDDDTGHPRTREEIAEIATKVVAILEERATTSAGDVHDGPQRPFVGRDREVLALRAAFDVAVAGHLSLALVSGEPGIGKTALVEQLVREARGRGASVHWGRGWEGGDAPPLWMWSQVFRGLAAVAPPTPVADEGVAMVDKLASVLDPNADPAPISTAGDAVARDDAQLSQFDALSELLAVTSQHHALVVVLDDLHWADPASLALLRFIAQDRRLARVLIVGTYRDTEPDRPHVHETLAAVARADHVVHVALQGLEVDDAGRVADAYLGRAAAPDVVRALHADTNGNPFFIKQIVRLIREQQAGDPVGEGLPVPRTVTEVIGRRLALLPTGCVAVLEAAAVIGRDFRFEQLTALPRYADVALAPLLDELERTRILTPTNGAAGWTFTHDVLRSTVLAGIGAARTAALHFEIAEAFVELRAQGSAVDVEALALHFARSGTAVGRAEGFSYAREAAARAQSLFAHEDAARLLALASELGDGVMEPDDQLALLLAEANERFLAGDNERGRSRALDAARIARQQGNAEALARAGFVMSRITSRWVNDPVALAVLEDALAALPPGDSPLKVSLDARRAAEYFYSDPERTRALSADAVRRARELGDDAALVDALLARRYAIWTPDDVEELLVLGAEVARLAPRAGRPEVASHGHFARRAAFHELGDIASMEREMRALERLADEQRIPADHAVVAGFWAMQAAAAGDFQRAHECIDRATSIATRMGDDELAVSLIPLQVWLAREERQFDVALGLLNGASAFQPDSLVIEAALMVTMSTAGVAVAPDRLHRLVARFDEPRGDWLWLGAVAEAAACAYRIGDATSAAALAARLEGYAASGRNVTCGPTLSFGSASYYAGICAITTGDLDRALGWLVAAIADNQRMGAQLWVLRSFTAAAAALDARDSGDDRKRRDDLVARGAAIADALDPCVAVDEFRALA